MRVQLTSRARIQFQSFDAVERESVLGAVMLGAIEARKSPGETAAVSIAVHVPGLAIAAVLATRRTAIVLSVQRLRR
jgi:hypothetical protein